MYRCGVGWVVCDLQKTLYSLSLYNKLHRRRKTKTLNRFLKRWVVFFSLLFDHLTIFNSFYCGVTTRATCANGFVLNIV